MDYPVMLHPIHRKPTHFENYASFNLFPGLPLVQEEGEKRGWSEGLV